MPSAYEVYPKCDMLDGLPEVCSANYQFELDFVAGALPAGAAVLQVGSMDGVRAIRLMQARPDLVLTGLDIDASFIELARRNVRDAGIDAKFVLGDIMDPPVHIGRFDHVICLNNTLGYIATPEVAVARMKALGGTVITSVYGETFDDKLAAEYFATLGLTVESIAGNTFLLTDFGTMSRFTRSDVASGHERVVTTPIGYLGVSHPA